MTTPDGPVTLRDLDGLAEQVLAPDVFGYIAAGAGDGVTLQRNLDAWTHYELLPNWLVDRRPLDLKTVLLGQEVAAPFGVSPTAFHGLVTPEGELATAGAAAEAGVMYCASSSSSVDLADIAATAGPARWYQCYVNADPAATDEVLARAVAHGFGAVVLTVDVPTVGFRDREHRTRRRLGGGERYDQLWPYTDPAAPRGLPISPVTPDLLADIVGRVGVPVVVKGVLSATDAERSCAAGAAAVWVSNHGGRQLDRSPATIDALRDVVEAVDGRAEVYLDGGVRRGADVVTALALGADAVFVGRPVLFGLAIGGRAGASSVLAQLRDELTIDLALMGVSRPAELDASHVRR